jgi:hypothetical protein
MRRNKQINAHARRRSYGPLPQGPSHGVYVFGRVRVGISGFISNAARLFIKFERIFSVECPQRHFRKSKLGRDMCLWRVPAMLVWRSTRLAISTHQARDRKRGRVPFIFDAKMRCLPQYISDKSQNYRRMASDKQSYNVHILGIKSIFYGNKTVLDPVFGLVSQSPSSFSN